jgi:hypothetical protein
MTLAMAVTWCYFASLLIVIDPSHESAWSGQPVVRCLLRRSAFGSDWTALRRGHPGLLLVGGYGYVRIGDVTSQTPETFFVREFWTENGLKRILKSKSHSLPAERGKEDSLGMVCLTLALIEDKMSMDYITYPTLQDSYHILSVFSGSPMS